MDELEGINPDDIAELEAVARKIVDDASTYYEINMLVPHSSAVDFLKKYEQAAEGDVMAIFEMMGVIHTIAQNIYTAIHAEHDEDQ